MPTLLFHRILALALVIQVTADDCGRDFTRASTSTTSAGDAPQNFSLEILRGMQGVDGVSHHYPFVFSWPVTFYDVSLHSVIVGDEDSDVAHVPFIVHMVTLDEY